MPADAAPEAGSEVSLKLAAKTLAGRADGFANVSVCGDARLSSGHPLKAGLAPGPMPAHVDDFARETFEFGDR